MPPNRKISAHAFTSDHMVTLNQSQCDKKKARAFRICHSILPAMAIHQCFSKIFVAFSLQRKIPSDSSAFKVSMADRTSRKRNIPARLREGKKFLTCECLKFQKLMVSFL